MGRDIPIIFSAAMVQALLAGRKTMTRRLATSPLRKVRPGDRLWVRESLKHVTSDPVTAEPCSVHCYTASIPPGMTSANPYEPNYLFSEDGAPSLKPKSIPSIHMPRWASRLTLIVTAVKIEPLQEISEIDAEAEGVEPAIAGVASDGGPLHTYRTGFVYIWRDLHGADSWLSNPEVAAITFRAIKANIDAAEALAA